MSNMQENQGAEANKQQGVQAGQDNTQAKMADAPVDKGKGKAVDRSQDDDVEDDSSDQDSAGEQLVSGPSALESSQPYLRFVDTGR